jgi:diguanylate cyclase (GGDEF)-like protein
LDHDRPFCLTIIDVDFFKKINDTFGHALGDEVLKALAAVLQEHSNQPGFVARLGGEEFLAVFPDMTADQARPICESMRVAVESRQWDLLHPNLRVTASFGLAANNDTAAYQDMLATADERLYEAKRNGRNQVVAP